MRRARLVLPVLTLFVGSFAACSGSDAPPAPSFALRAVCREEIARLEAAIGPAAPSPAPEADLRERVLGLALDSAHAQGKPRRYAITDAAALGVPIVPVLCELAEDPARDAGVRKIALEMLAAIEAPAAVEALAERVDIRIYHDPWLRAQSAFLLSRIASDAWLPRVLPQLAHESDGETVLWIAAALAHHRNYAGLDALAVMSSSAAMSEDIRSLSAGMLAEIAREAGAPDPDALRAAWRGTTAGQGAATLPRQEPSPALRLAMWKSIAALGEFNLRFVDDARSALVHGGPWVVDLLVLALHEQDEHVRLHVTQCLDRIGPHARAACPELVLALDEPRIAAGAATALGGAGCVDALPVLIGRTGAAHAADVRAAATAALGRLGEAPALTALRALLDPAEPRDLRQIAATSMLSLGDESASIPLLIECLAHPIADRDGAESTLEAWIARAAAGGDAAAAARLEAWRAAGAGITGIPTPEQVEVRRAARVRLLQELTPAPK